MDLSENFEMSFTKLEILEKKQLIQIFKKIKVIEAFLPLLDQEQRTSNALFILKISNILLKES